MENTLIFETPLLECLCEADAFTWIHGGIDPTSTLALSEENPSLLVGLALLKHSPFLPTIYSHFSSLEARKCKLKLVTSQPNRIFQLPVINEEDFRRSSLETPDSNIDPCRRLSDAEWALFRHAFMVVSYPILGRPQPPSASHSPVEDDDTHTYEASHRLENSLAQEADAVAAIPEETLTELLKSIFGLPPESFLFYQQKILEKMGRKTPAKVLAEELHNRLFVLENNCHSFYSPGAFLSRNAYDQWQQRQRIHINSLFQKFWYQALPNLRTPVRVSSKHKEYDKLLLMLFKFEHPVKMRKREVKSERLIKSSILSSAALRLLQEFALRYGIDETYTKLAYIRYLVEQYLPVPWYLQHLSSHLSSFLECFPSHSLRAIITKAEHSLCQDITHFLLRDILPKTFLRLRHYFCENKPVGGVGLLVRLTYLVTRIECFVKNGVYDPEILRERLNTYMEQCISHEYENHKKSALEHVGSTAQNAMMLNLLLINIKNTANDLIANFEKEFVAYFNLRKLSYCIFYNLFMEDVCLFATLSLPRLDPQAREIDLQMVGLMFKLNELDEDWSLFVRPDVQRWRKIFFHLIFHWTKVLQYHAVDMVLESLDNENTHPLVVKPCSLMSNLPASIETPFTVSMNSAFTPVGQKKLVALIPSSGINELDELEPCSTPIARLSPVEVHMVDRLEIGNDSCSSSDTESLFALQVDSLHDFRPHKSSKHFDLSEEAVMSISEACNMDDGIFVSQAGDASDTDRSTPKFSPLNGEVNTFGSETQFRPIDANAVAPKPLRQMSVWSNPYHLPQKKYIDFFKDIIKSNEAVKLQISSSMVDILVLCQRLVHTVETFAKTVCPISETVNTDCSLRNIFHDRLRMRSILYLALIQGISKIVQVYCNNFVCMDLCGTHKAKAREIVDIQLISFLEEEFKNFRVWGCRHDYSEQVDADCLSEKSEVQSIQFQAMLLRISNLYNLYKCLKWVFENCLIAFQAPNLDPNPSPELESGFIMVDMPKLSSNDFGEDVEYFDDLIYGDCSEHVQKCYVIELKLLASKTVEAIYPLFPMLLVKSGTNTIEKKLEHLTNYLVSVYDTLVINLYPECLCDYYSEFWKRLASSLKQMISRVFKSSQSHPSEEAETLLASISYLIKFMRTLENSGLELDFLHNEMEDNVFWLSLMICPTHQLIIRFLAMSDFEISADVQDLSSGRRSSMFTPNLPCSPDFLLQMALALHQFKKCFSGLDLLTWIMTHKDSQQIFDCKEEALNLCQHLLDFNIIKVMPFKFRKASDSSLGHSYQANPAPTSVTFADVGRGFEDTYEQDESSITVFEKQEFEITKEVVSSPEQSVSPTSESVSTESSLNLDHFHDRPNIYYRFLISTYEEEELSFLTESQDEMKFVSDADKLKKIRNHFQTYRSEASDRVAAGTVELEKCIMKGVTAKHLLELLCRRACNRDAFAQRFLVTMDNHGRNQARDVLINMGLDKNVKDRRNSIFTQLVSSC